VQPELYLSRCARISGKLTGGTYRVHAHRDHDGEVKSQ